MKILNLQIPPYVRIDFIQLALSQSPKSKLPISCSLLFPVKITKKHFLNFQVIMFIFALVSIFFRFFIQIMYFNFSCTLCSSSNLCDESSVYIHVLLNHDLSSYWIFKKCLMWSSTLHWSGERRFNNGFLFILSSPIV